MYRKALTSDSLSTQELPIPPSTRSLQLAARSSPPARRSQVLQNSVAPFLFLFAVAATPVYIVYLRTVISHVCCPSVRPPGRRLSTTNVAASRNTLPSALSRPFRCCDSSVNLPPLRRSRMCSAPFGRRTCPPPWRPCVASTSSPAAERRCWWHPSHRTLESILSISRKRLAVCRPSSPDEQTQTAFAAGARR